MQKVKCIGIMTGTSLDGVDLVFVEFSYSKDSYDFNIIKSICLAYKEEIRLKLQKSVHLSKIELDLLDMEYGEYLSECVNEFIRIKKINKSEVDFVASHGYTVFHQPDKGFTHQIGCGKKLAESCGIDVINDFRSNDVTHGGQGAPLVPIGDSLLFSNYDACLNLGGFANITLLNQDKIIAFDISPANLPLNAIAKLSGRDYDKDGDLGREGTIDLEILNKLNNIHYYSKLPPKSLGTEWLEDEFYTVVEVEKENMATIYEHISYQIANVLNQFQCKNVLITGGGAYNGFLIEEIQGKTSAEINIPTKEIIEFKEALIFAFLGLRFKENKHNCLATVTGASKNVKGGVFHSSI